MASFGGFSLYAPMKFCSLLFGPSLRSIGDRDALVLLVRLMGVALLTVAVSFAQHRLKILLLLGFCLVSQCLCRNGASR
jgi:hypothetical protein